ncbi:MAG: hypothetical protein AB9907_07320 [Flexilinea sp.]
MRVINPRHTGLQIAVQIERTAQRNFYVKKRHAGITGIESIVLFAITAILFVLILMKKSVFDFHIRHMFAMAALMNENAP